jgi:AraC family transcriptional regulator
MNQCIVDNLTPPRFVNSKARLIVGISEHYSCESSAGIPAQWQRFLPHFGNVPGQIGRKAYGVNYNHDELENFDYLCGVEVPDFTRVPQGWAHVRIPEHRYAVFTHSEHISTIRRTWNTIWNSWFPGSGHEVADAPYFELYGESFNSQTGAGGLEIWVPIRQR